MENRVREEKLRQGLDLQRQGKLREAEALFADILAEDPRNADACNWLGIIASQKGDHDAANRFLGRAVEINPSNPGYHCNLGLALQRANQLDAAVASYDRALSIKPDYAQAYCNRGIALRELGQLEPAVDSYDHAIALKPDYAEAYSNRAVALSKLQKYDEAVKSCDRAIAIRPNYAEAYFNRGNALSQLERFEEALASFDRAIALKPNYADALLSKSTILLARGDFEDGWRLHEWRWAAPLVGISKKQICAEWDKVSRPKSLLIMREQGLGDEIFYAGMIHDTAGRADALTVCVDPRLIPVFQRSFPGVDFIAESDVTDCRDFDAQISMGSLGGVVRTTAEDFARIKSPYLIADAARAKHLREQLPRDKLICGLSWVSKNKLFGSAKSLSLDHLIPILSLPNIAFVNLQYGDTQDEQRALQSERGLKLFNITEIDNLNDIEGLTALIEACDVVVTVSNTTAHLAAALGKPVHVLLPSSAGLLWYWRTGQSRSRWYPTVTLHRQPQSGGWEPIIEDIRVELTKLCE